MRRLWAIDDMCSLPLREIQEMSFSVDFQPGTDPNLTKHTQLVDSPVADWHKGKLKWLIHDSSLK